MRTPLLRYELRTYRAAQRARAMRFMLTACAIVFAGIGLGMAAAAGTIWHIVIGLCIGSAIGYFLHSLTRPMP